MIDISLYVVDLDNIPSPICGESSERRSSPRFFTAVGI